MGTRTNAEWLRDLRVGGGIREDALTDLRAIILSGLPYALANWLSPDNPDFDSLAEETAQETLLRVMDRLDSFEGRSQFTTWTHKIAVRIALSELRRRRWRDVSLDNLVGDESDESNSMMADTTPGPDATAEHSDLYARIQRLIMEELTEKQRRAMIAVAIKGMPLGEGARRMGMERNALYKLMHDARLRLKRRMAREGLTPHDVLAVFDR
jgi:RNA polymerase sigma-70 factor (ECF subfamily)